jgi:hypothetical protein
MRKLKTKQQRLNRAQAIALLDAKTQARESLIKQAKIAKDKMKVTK